MMVYLVPNERWSKVPFVCLFRPSILVLVGETDLSFPSRAGDQWLRRKEIFILFPCLENGNTKAFLKLFPKFADDAL